MIIKRFGSGYIATYGKRVLAVDLSRSGAIVKAVKRLWFTDLYKNYKQRYA
jgi:hypothetical protein